MNKYITNIEQSKKLKEIGVPQKSFFGVLDSPAYQDGAFSKPWPVGAIAAFTIQELIDILGSEFFELCDCRDFAAKQGKYLAVGGASDNTWEAYGNTMIEAVYNLILLLFAKGELTFKN
jgi:hypothetical protein